MRAVGLSVPASTAATWFGLWDLGAADGADLLGVAAVHPAGPGEVELDVLAVLPHLGGRTHGRRLIDEVVNRTRADGVDRLFARVPSGSGERRLLLAAGFVDSTPGQDVDGAGTLLRREL